MAEDNNKNIRCFLCRRKGHRSRVQNSIETTKCPVSGKFLKDVLQHLARVSKTELHIPKTEMVCNCCHVQLLEYDSTMVKLLNTQKSLTKLIEDAAIAFDSDIEKECDEHMSTMDELNNEDIFSDFNISDKEMRQTLDEAIHGSKSTILNNTNKQEVPRKKPTPRTVLDCLFCVMKFRSYIKLQKHVSKAHHKHTCELCNFSHRNEDYVMLHMNIHQGRPETQCRFCDKLFTTKISTIRHMEMHMNSKKYQCDKCGLCFSQTTVLYNHKLQHEAEEDPLRCETCNQVFKTKRTYRHHMITHQANRPRYSCEYCTKTFTEKYTLKVHKRTHGEMVEPLPQSVINVVQQTLLLPQSDADNQLEAKLSCIICEQQFVSKDQLNKHMEKEHDVILKSLTLSNFSQYEVVNNEPRKSCHVCGHMFSTQSNLDFHLGRVHGLQFI